MNKTSLRIRHFLFSAALLLLAAATLNAQTYAELGDAGASANTGQSTGLANNLPLSAISGTILGGFDGDLYYITITNPATFSATTVGQTPGVTLDTLLFLFTLNGSPLYLNDDASGLSFQSTLPAGSAFGPQFAGTYILGISLSGAEPVNAANQLLFADAAFSTDLRGPRAGALGPVAGVSQASFEESGLYTIALTGAATSAIPEPSTTALLLLSGVGGVVAWRRRSRKTQS